MARRYICAERCGYESDELTPILGGHRTLAVCPDCRSTLLSRDRMRRPLCRQAHPSYPHQVRCEEPRGHAGDHFHSFYMRSWSTPLNQVT